MLHNKCNTRNAYKPAAYLCAMDNKPLPSLSGLGNEINTQPLQIEMNQIIRNHATESVDYINLLDHLFRKFANPPSDTHFERIYTYMSETYPAWVVWYDKHSFAKLYQMEMRYTYANFELKNDYRTNLQKENDEEIDEIDDALSDRTRNFTKIFQEELLRRCVDLERSINTEPGEPYKKIRLLRLKRNIIYDINSRIQMHTQHAVTFGVGE